MALKVNEWQSLQGGLPEGSPISAVSRGEKIDCLVRGMDNALWLRSWDGAAWADWSNLGGGMTADPTAISGADDRIDCFVRGADNGMWQRSLRGDTWIDWVKLDGKLAGSPAAVPHEGVRVDVLIRGENGELWCRSSNGASWADWYSLQGGLSADPVAVSAAPTHVNVFVRGTDSALWTRTWAGQWEPWVSLGGGIQEEPTVVCRGERRADVFVRGLDNHRLWHRAGDGSRWLDWVDLGGGLASKPVAVARGKDRIDVFARGTDDHLWRRYWDGTRWSDWEDLGGSITSTPAVVATRSGELVVFARGSDRALWYIAVKDVAKTMTGGGGTGGGARPATVIDTSPLLAAAVERLNRQSVLALLQQMVQEIDEHCRVFPGKIDEEIVLLRKELTVQIESLRVAVDKYQVTIQEINAALISLQTQYGDFLAKFETNVGGIVNNHISLKLPDIIRQVTTNLDVTIQQKIDAAITQVDVSALLVKLEAMNAKLELLKKAAEELDGGELEQVELLLKQLLLNIDLSSVLVNMRVDVGGARFRLDELLAILAGGDKVAQIHFAYHAGDIVGARFVLIDRTEVTFVCTRSELPGGEVDLLFRTLDWKGVPASFTLRFRKNTLQLSMCKRTIAVDSYDVLYQTNVVFDLPAPKTPRIPDCGEPPPKVEAHAVTQQELPAEEEVAVVNGSFEEGPPPGTHVTMNGGDTRIVGWTVGGGGIDYVGTTWQPGDSLLRSVDLNGFAPGSIEQTLRTAPGATYKVTWVMAGNPGGAPRSKTMTVAATGANEASFSFDTRGKTFTAMGWTERSYTFTATATSTVLKFASTTSGPYGPTIDNVQVVRVK